MTSSLNFCGFLLIINYVAIWDTQLSCINVGQGTGTCCAVLVSLHNFPLKFLGLSQPLMMCDTSPPLNLDVSILINSLLNTYI